MSRIGIYLGLLSIWRVPFIAASTSDFDPSSISAVSWSTGNVDVLGLDPNGKIWHKYNRGNGWLPGRSSFESMNTSISLSKPTAVSSQPNRMDFLYIAKNHNAHLKYWLGQDWNPKSGPENLGGYFSSAISAASWAPDRINIVGRGKDLSYWHSFWDGIRWRPSNAVGTENGKHEVWENIGGEFAGQAALVSPWTSRMDIFGITSKGRLKHKYWDQNRWVPSQLGWEDLGGPFTGSPVASSPKPGRLDIWVLSQTWSLLYSFAEDSYHFSQWQDLGGEFYSTPQVVHPHPGHTMIVGRDRQSSSYISKYWNGSRWHPEGPHWEHRGKYFSSDPALVSTGTGVLHIFSVSDDGKLVEQRWTRGTWSPSETGWIDLGSIRESFSSSETLRNGEL